MTLDLLLVLLLQILLLLTLLLTTLLPQLVLLTLMLQLVLLTLMLQLVLQSKFKKYFLRDLRQKLIQLNQLAQFHHLHAPQDIIQTLMEIVSQMSALQKSSIMDNNFAKLVIFQMDKVDV